MPGVVQEWCSLEVDWKLKRTMCCGLEMSNQPMPLGCEFGLRASAHSAGSIILCDWLYWAEKLIEWQIKNKKNKKNHQVIPHQLPHFFLAGKSIRVHSIIPGQILVNYMNFHNGGQNKAVLCCVQVWILQREELGKNSMPSV